MKIDPVALASFPLLLISKSFPLKTLVNHRASSASKRSSTVARKGPFMSVSRLAALDRHTISVELSQNGSKKTLHGTAVYGRDPALGGVLTINVREEWGDFDFILREDEFDGEIAVGTGGSDFQICLSSGCVCTS